MGTLFISLLTLFLLLISFFVVLIVLMQRTSQTGGMGAALGGGAAESAFGAETTNVLTKGTIYGIIAYFVVALGLYLIYQARYAESPVDIDPAALISAEEGEPAAEVTTAVDSAATDGASEGTNEALSGSADTPALDADSADPAADPTTPLD